MERWKVRAPDRREVDVQSEEVRRRPRRWVLVSASCVVLLVVLAVVANVVLTRYVKDRVVQVLRCATGDDTITPTVSLGRTPLLVGLASRELDQVTISGLSPSSIQTMDGVATAADPSSDALVGDLSITLHGVGLGDPPTTKSADASVRLGWDGLQGALSGSSVSSGSFGAPGAADSAELAGATLAEEDGLLAVSLAEKVGGRSVKVLVSLQPNGDSMTVTPQSVVIGGRRIGVGLVSLLAGDALQDANGESRLKPREVDLDLPREWLWRRSRCSRPGWRWV